MTDGLPHPTVDALLDAFIAAWHAGDAPSAAQFAGRAAPADQDELLELIGAFLQLAPTVEPSSARAAELEADPVLARLAGLEPAWWDERSAGEAKAGVATELSSVGEGAAKAGSRMTEPEADAASWGARLRVLREAAGLSVGDLAERFAARFGLGGAEASAAPAALAALETGSLPSTGVTARAARAIEELLQAPKGTLVAGAAPAFGGPVLRGALPEGDDDRARYADLFREVDEALTADGVSVEPGAETLHGLLGA